MSEEPNATPETPGTPTEPRAQISEAELETLKADAAQFAKIKEEANNVGFDNVEDYQDFLVTKKAEELDKEQPTTPQPAVNPKSVSKPATQPQKTAEELQQVQVEKDALEQRLNRSETMASTSYLQSDYVLFQMDQRDLPEEQRSKHTKKELYAFISDKTNGTLVRDEAKASGENLCVVADRILSIKDQLEAQRKGKAAPPLDPASTQVGQGMSPRPEPKEGDKTPQQLLAEAICPDEEFVAQTQ